jgi:hypothetical protein
MVSHACSAARPCSADEEDGCTGGLVPPPPREDSRPPASESPRASARAHAPFSPAGALDVAYRCESAPCYRFFERPRRPGSDSARSVCTLAGTRRHGCAWPSRQSGASPRVLAPGGSGGARFDDARERARPQAAQIARSGRGSAREWSGATGRDLRTHAPCRRAVRLLRAHALILSPRASRDAIQVQRSTIIRENSF